MASQGPLRAVYRCSAIPSGLLASASPWNSTSAVLLQLHTCYTAASTLTPHHLSSSSLDSHSIKHSSSSSSSSNSTAAQSTHHDRETLRRVLTSNTWGLTAAHAYYHTNNSSSNVSMCRGISSSSSSSAAQANARVAAAAAAGAPDPACAAGAAAGSRLASKLHLPPVAVAAAASTGALLTKASKAAAKQVSSLVKLVQQTSALQAVSLQLSSIWQQHSTAITTLAAAAASAGLYQLTYSAAAYFVDMAAPEAMYVCAVASAAAVVCLGFWVRSGLVVDADRVYQVAMRKITRHAGLQEVMGTPLTGSPMRVQLISRGSYFIQQSLLPRRRAPRIHMLFPVAGPNTSGVVSLQAKKLSSGKYAFKTLLVELPSKTLTGAAGTEAATSAALHAAAAAKCSDAGDDSSAAAAAAASTLGNSSSSGSSDMSRKETAADTDQHARVYIIGKPRISSSSSSTGSSSSSTAATCCQVPTAQVLLEQLKQPLVFALQQNLVVYETEDELESDVLNDDVTTAVDPDQLTLWDRAKQGTCSLVNSSIHAAKLTGCATIRLGRQSVLKIQTALSKIQQQQQQQPPPPTTEAAAAAANSTTTEGSNASAAAEQPRSSTSGSEGAGSSSSSSSSGQGTGSRSSSSSART